MIQSNSTKVVNTCLIILTVIATTTVLYFMKPVLVPFAFSVFLFFVISPVIQCLHNRFRIPKVISLVLVLVSLLATFFLLLILMGVSVNGFIRSSETYQLNLLALLDRVSIFFQEYNIKVNLNLIRDTLLNLPILNWIRSISGGLIGFVGDLFLVLIFTFFLIVGSEAHEGEGGNVVSEEIKNRINRYLTVKFFTSSATAIFVGIFFQVIDLKLALMFALTTFILNFIPTVGSIIATLLPIPIIFIQFGFGWTALIAILIPATIQFSVGNIIDPKLMGSSLGLHPVVVLLALLFWGFIWGVAGMFLSVPLTAVLKLILMRFNTTRKIALILEGSV